MSSYWVFLLHVSSRHFVNDGHFGIGKCLEAQRDRLGHNFLCIQKQLYPLADSPITHAKLERLGSSSFVAGEHLAS